MFLLGITIAATYALSGPATAAGVAAALTTFFMLWRD